MPRRSILILSLCAALTGSGAQLYARSSNGFLASISSRLKPTIARHGYSLPQRLLMTTLLSCSMLSCGTVNLYTLGIMERSGKTKAEMTTNALRAAQLQETGAGDAQLLHQHVYVNRFDPLKDDVLAEVVAEKSDLLVIVKRYAERHSMTIHNKEITGFLIDDHPYVGQNIRLSTEEVGISHLIGEVFAVYSNGMCALKIVAKIDFEGQSDKLGKQFEDHLRLLPTYYVELELDRRAKTD